MTNTDLEFLRSLIVEAGEIVLRIYVSDFSVDEKADGSPLTRADLESHKLIEGELRHQYPDIPVLSEEGKGIPYQERRDWEYFWLVDPVDGTKEFVNRIGEFTVNIALMKGCQPVAGAVYCPPLDLLYLGDVSQGAWRISRNDREALRVRAPDKGEVLRLVQSRFHGSHELETLLASFPPYETSVRGSSLKFCAVAEGAAHLYVRMGPTWEWDTAAGQAIVEAAGGVVVDSLGKPLTYNKPDLLNPPLLAASSIRWLEQYDLLKKVREQLETG